MRSPQLRRHRLPALQRQKDSVHGLIASVSGNAVQVTEKNGTATVDVSPSAKVTEYTKAQLTDVAAGNCVRVVVQTRPGPRWPCHGHIRATEPAGGRRQVPATEARSSSPGAPHQPVPADRHGCFCGG